MNVGWSFELEAAGRYTASGSTFREELGVSELFENRFTGVTVFVPLYGARGFIISVSRRRP